MTDHSSVNSASNPHSSIRPFATGDGQICEEILRSLPDWFGIESSLMQYVRDAASYPTWMAAEHGPAVGFVTLHQHFSESAEIHCMAVVPDRHRRGIGRALVAQAEMESLRRGCRFLQVKTQGPSRPCEFYERTRRFYRSVGFMPLEEIHGLWPGNPCLLMVKCLVVDKPRAGSRALE